MTDALILGTIAASAFALGALAMAVWLANDMQRLTRENKHWRACYRHQLDRNVRLTDERDFARGQVAALALAHKREAA